MEKKIKKLLFSFLITTLVVGNLFFPFLTSATPGIIFEDGFESGDFSAWDATDTSTGDTAEVITTDPYRGTYHANFKTDGSDWSEAAYSYEIFTVQPIVYTRSYIKFNKGLPQYDDRFIEFTVLFAPGANKVAIAKVAKSTDVWRLDYFKNGSMVSLDADFGPSLDTWYCVELYIKISGTAGEVKLYVDGLQVLSDSGFDNDDYGNVEVMRSGIIVNCWIGTEQGAYIDSVKVADTYIGCNPNSPSSLGPTNYVNGSWISDKTPTLQFTQSDPDSSDTIRYRIQIDNNPDFSSPVIDYTSDYLTQGVTTFTVGQAPGTGTYTQGSQGQTLTNGSYYWQVMSEDQRGETSSWTKANSGNLAFKLSIAKIYTGVTNTIYANGTVSYSQQPNSNNLINFNLVPSYGSVDVTILTWQTSGDYLKEWTENASQPGIVTDHTVGDLKPNTSYNILVNNTIFTQKTSDATGEINFLYDQGYSEKTFKIEQTPEELAPTGYNISSLFYVLPLTFLLIGFTLLKLKRE